MVFWEEDHRGDVSFSHPIYQGHILSRRLENVHLDYLAKAVFARFLHCKVTFLRLFILYSLEASHEV